MILNKYLHYVGVDDLDITLFEGQYPVKNGMCYNSYVIDDEKICIMDTVDKRKTSEWMEKIKDVLGDKKPTYLVVQHMEPDHSASIKNLLDLYPQTILVGNKKTFVMIEKYFQGMTYQKLEVNDGDTLSLGESTLQFVFAPFVHWPEVMMTYWHEQHVLFSADGFGKFGSYNADEPWDDEARRYYIGIVGKYGKPVQNILAKASKLNIEMICPLHGPVLTDNLGHYLSLYDTWSSYKPEEDGVCICFNSVYGNTKKACEILYEALVEKHKKVVMYDLSITDITLCVSEAFRYSKLVLASPTYNGDVFPHMKSFIDHLTERNFQNRTVCLIDNGSWVPCANKVMLSKLGCTCSLRIAATHTINASVNEKDINILKEMADLL